MKKKQMFPLLIKGETASPPSAGDVFQLAWTGVICGLVLLGVN